LAAKGNPGGKASRPATRHHSRRVDRRDILPTRVAITILALTVSTVSTSTYLTPSRPVGLSILAVGVAIMFW
jgi:hypothetical protein